MSGESLIIIEIGCFFVFFVVFFFFFFFSPITFWCPDIFIFLTFSLTLEFDSNF